MEYTSNFSINFDLYKGLEDAQGMYNSETGTGLIFLEKIKIIAVHEGGPCGADYLGVGVRMMKTDISNADLISFGNSKTGRHNKTKWIRKSNRNNSMDKFMGESELLKKIITIDFHEFIHHFLHTNNIKNHCCDEEAHMYDLENMRFGTCWLCNFTHNLKPKVNMGNCNRQDLSVLEHFGPGVLS